MKEKIENYILKCVLALAHSSLCFLILLCPFLLTNERRDYRAKQSKQKAIVFFWTLFMRTTTCSLLEKIVPGEGNCMGENRTRKYRASVERKLGQGIFFWRKEKLIIIKFNVVVHNNFRK